ncbi:hypothetical protein [Acidiphilium angustum]|uniref:hypothetical protein n=1 Tax=Acidiphilium angustum TaxID=523 RepID=UPI0012DE341B|nr:hypothetical protein [Acidiphilium angustum]
MVKDVVVQIRIPPSLQTCSAAPPVPYPVRRQSTVAHYVYGLWMAWRNCSETLSAVVGAVNAQDAAARSVASPAKPAAKP